MAEAQTTGISVQFDGSGTALSSTGTAGVIALANYNALSGASGSISSGLVDSTGTLTSLSLTFSSSYTNASYNGTPSTDNQKLMSGGISVNSPSSKDTVTLSNIPYASYSLYVYVGPNDGNGGNSYFDNAVTDGTTTYYSYFPGGNFGGFTQATSTVSGTYTANANYILFTGETSSSLTFSLTPVNNGGSDINGFQIIDTAAVPEPGTIGYLSIGLLFGGFCYFRRTTGRC